MKNVIQGTTLTGTGAVSVAPGAEITIRNPAGQLVPLWLDRDGTQEAGNPFYADSTGFFRVYADSGWVHVRAQKDGSVREWRYVPIGSAAAMDIGEVYAALGSEIYSSVSEGLSNSAEGDYFLVESSGSLDLYRVVNGVAEQRAAGIDDNAILATRAYADGVAAEAESNATNAAVAAASAAYQQATEYSDSQLQTHRESGDHDGRYYTKTEVDQALDDKLDALVGEAPDQVPTNAIVDEKLDAIIGPEPGQGSLLNFFIERQITHDEYTRHKAFGITDVLPDGRILHVYREGVEHAISQSALKMISSDDGGVTWSPATVVYEMANYDVRNCAGGVLPNGRFALAFEAVPLDTGDNFTYVMMSDDGGATWSPAQTVSTGATRLVPHGKVVSTSKGTMFFAYSGHRSAYMILSTDGGDTWIGSKIKDAAEFGTAEFVEPYAVHVGGDRVILVARDESTAGSTAIVFSSVDGGSTWSTPKKISNIPLGKNPPALWYNSGTGRVWLIWASRGPDRAPSGGTGDLWPWYISQIDADAFFAGAGWRDPVALPLFSPLHSPGDSGYQHVIMTANGLRMVYYRGGQPAGHGTDYYIANLGVLLG